MASDPAGDRCGACPHAAHGAAVDRSRSAPRKQRSDRSLRHPRGWDRSRDRPIHTRRSDMSIRSGFIAALIALSTGAGAHAADGPIRLGDINSYKAMAANTGPYRKGVELAIE